MPKMLRQYSRKWRMQDIRLRILLSVIIISFILIIDYESKKFIETLNQTVILNSFITFHKVNNHGIAFSIFDKLDSSYSDSEDIDETDETMDDPRNNDILRNYFTLGDVCPKECNSIR